MPSRPRPDTPWVRFSGRSKGGPESELSRLLRPIRWDVPLAVTLTELSPDYPGDGRGDRAPIDVPRGEGFGTGC